MKEEKEYRDYDEQEGSGKAIGYALAWTLSLFALLLTAIIISTFTSCTTTKYVPVESVRTDSTTVVKYVDRTIIERDTVQTIVNGDTVTHEIVRWRIRTVESHDTMSVIERDTIREPYPIERELSRWEQTKMDFGGMAFGVLLAVIAIAVLWLLKKKKTWFK